MPLRAGQILRKRYRIDELLGQGGMGAVYRAWDLNLNITVAIKENLILDEKAQRQFSREASILANLRHPHLPRVGDHFFIPGQGQYLVMDYIEGQDLDKILASRGLPSQAQAVQWIHQVLDALEYLHRQNIIHRDVKPANVKITPQGQVFLVDFGLAKVHDPLQRTTIGARGVTPGYAPPEQYGQARTDARSDVYSAGATLYTLLTGQTPTDALQLVVGQAQLSPPQVVHPDVSPEVNAAVIRAMQVHPNDRFQTVAEFRAALPGSQATTPILARRGRPVSGPDAQKRSRSPWLILAGVSVPLLILGIALIALLGGGGSPTVTPSPVPPLTGTAVSDPRPTRPAPGGTQTISPTETSPLPSAGTSTSQPDLRASVTPSPTAPPSATPTLPPPASTPIVRGTSEMQLTNDPADEYVPSFSPDGRQVVYMSNRDGSWQIYLMDADGSDAVRLTTNDADNYHPRFSPDGQTIVFASKMDGDWDIYLMGLDGQIISQVTDQPGNQYYPFFSPDGSSLSFMGRTDGQWEIYLTDLAGSNLRNLTNHPADDVYPTFAPGGEDLVFQSDRDGNWEIYRLNLSSGEILRLTTDESRDADPVVSPDGSWIAFESNRGGSYDIYVMDWEGNQVQRLTTDSAEDQVPAFAPDGSGIIFQSTRSSSIDLYVLPFRP